MAWSAWLTWRTERDLREADAAVERLRIAIADGDETARDEAVTDLQASAASAAGRTDGLWWAGLTRLPIYGDDLAGVRSLSKSVDVVATDAVEPLIGVTTSLDGVVSEGRVDLARVRALKMPVDAAATAAQDAVEIVNQHDSENFVPALRTRYDDYRLRLTALARDFESARTAVDVLPDILGASGPRNYLFVFQNNAEIRSTGGLPGSWARIYTDNGEVRLREQGAAVDLNTGKPVLELTAAEIEVYDQLPALYFQDPNFIPDFPRVAEIFNAFWHAEYPETELDGVLTLDPVAMSYLLEGTGPIVVDGTTLTASNIVEELLSTTYLTIDDPVAQDLRFRRAARGIFGAMTSSLGEPAALVQGFARATRERRLLLAPFNDEDLARLADRTILGAIPGDDVEIPHVTVGLNDATGSKMSYYLRYSGNVTSRSCSSGVQQLMGSMILNQTISPRVARDLPAYVTGGGQFGIPVGSQLVTLRIYGPSGGTITNVRVGGVPLDVGAPVIIQGRPVVTVAPLIESLEDVIVTWAMSTGPGQTAEGVLNVTPSVVPGSSDSAIASSC